ncbi:MAG: hypothetical protein AAB473_03955 [Patescibacteria group bacterium]
MKRLLLSISAAVLLLTGAGCTSGIVSSITGGNAVEGKWKLAFDLPSGWVEVVGYAQPNESLPTLSQDVNHTMETVSLQSTDKPIARTTTPVDTISKEGYVSTDYTKIDVDTLDSRRSIPKDATDLGSGFWKAAGVANDCKPGSCTTTYYLQTSSGEKYMFTVWQVGQEASVAEAVILSAKPVTSFTDTVPAATASDVKTNE